MRAARLLLLFALGLLALPALAAAGGAIATQRAGALLDAAVDRPELGLPVARDPAALARARAALERRAAAAPDPHVWRLLGQAAAAAGDWPAAAAAYEAALREASDSPLIAWEAALAYEPMAQAVEAARFEDLPADACPPAECASAALALPDPRLSAAGLITHTTLLPSLAPAALTLDVPAERAGLRFLVGRGPGVTAADVELRIWARAAGERAIVYTRLLTAGELTAGWVAGWADLSPWAGRSVELLLETAGAGQRGLAWADLSLTSVDAARYSLLAPRERLRELLVAGGHTADALIARAGRATRAGQPQAALVWLARAAHLADRGDAFWLQAGRACQQLLTPEPLCERWRVVTGGNLLIDPSFGGGLWSVIDDPGMRYTAPVACPDLPELSCARISAETTPQPRGAAYYQCLRVEPGAAYTFSAWLRLDVSAAAESRRLYIQGEVAGQPRGIGSEINQGSLGWRLVERSFIAPEFVDGRACFYPLRLYGAGEAWIHNPILRRDD